MAHQQPSIGNSPTSTRKQQDDVVEISAPTTTTTTIIPTDNKLAAIISISEFDEEPQLGIRSIVKSTHFFKELHIVRSAYDPDQELYPGCNAHLREIQQKGCRVIWHSVLDLSKIHAHAIVHVAPDMQVKESAFQTLYDTMQYSVLHYPSYTHFAVPKVTVIDNATATAAEHHRRSNFFRSVWKKANDIVSGLSYGFLLVLTMLTWIRNCYFFAWNATHQTSDLRAEYIYIAYPQRVQYAPSRYIWNLFWDNQHYPLTPLTSGCIQSPQRKKDQGSALVLRTLKQERLLSIGMWIFMFAIYYWMVAYPWWNTFISSPMPGGGGWWWTEYFVKDIYNWKWQLFYVLHAIWTLLVVWRRYRLPQLVFPILILTLPLFVTMSPILFVYAKFHVSQATWKISTKKYNNNKKKV